MDRQPNQMRSKTSSDGQGIKETKGCSSVGCLRSWNWEVEAARSSPATQEFKILSQKQTKKKKAEPKKARVLEEQ